MDEQQAKVLLKKYTDGTATPKEREQVEAYYFHYLKERNAEPDHERLLKDQFDIRASLQSHIGADQIKSLPARKRFSQIAAAAVVLIGISTGGYFLLHKQQPQQIAQNKVQDIAPGHNQATLTLANGKKIVLVKGLSGTLAQQGNTLIQVNKQNAVAYNASIVTLPVAYNTLSTAKGEMSPYPLFLADGTKVWLDAQSSITFPTAFTGKERLVKITGQAYFEVAHNAAQPFKVSVRDMIVQDIGTAFNINAYTDEPVIKTTLVQGAVNVSLNGRTASLKPGQAALATSEALRVKTDDLDETTSWRNGDFTFNNENIQSIMRQLSRWYNIDVSYEGTPTNTVYTAKLSRYKNISQLLKILSLTQSVHFKIEERRVIVTP